MILEIIIQQSSRPTSCARNLIGTDFTAEGDHVLWRDAASGEELARTDALDAGKVFELRLDPPPA
jgi:hypothetical protein